MINAVFNGSGVVTVDDALSLTLPANKKRQQKINIKLYIHLDVLYIYMEFHFVTLTFDGNVYHSNIFQVLLKLNCG